MTRARVSPPSTTVCFDGEVMFVAQFVASNPCCSRGSTDDVHIGLLLYSRNPFDGAASEWVCRPIKTAWVSHAAHSQAFAACCYDDIIHIRLPSPSDVHTAFCFLQCLHLFVADEEMTMFCGHKGECCFLPFIAGDDVAVYGEEFVMRVQPRPYISQIPVNMWRVCPFSIPMLPSTIGAAQMAPNALTFIILVEYRLAHTS